ncbi:MAG: hypothetical protein FWB80_07410 [Defluviitaleaceae bacterium]|nr:hypothetical protein [Defluviitaleaceae bacterium]
MMAKAFYIENMKEDVIEMLYKLVINLKKRCVDQLENARNLTFVSYHLTCYLGLSGRYDEALALCNEAIEIGGKNYAFNYLPELKYNKAYCLHHLNRHDEVEALIHQAYYGCLSHEEKFLADEIKERAEKNFGIIIK